MMAFNVSSSVWKSLLTELSTSKDLMSDNDYIIVEGVISGLSVALAFVGILGNAVSILTFFSMGPKDGVTVTFLFMAATDLVYLVTVVAMGVSILFVSLEVLSGYAIWFPVEPYGVYGFLTMSGRYPYEVSNLATAWLSVVRCFCVAKPLLYRNTFNIKTALCFIATFSVFSIACFTPVLAFMDMKVQYSQFINASRPSTWISPTREQVKDIIWTVTDACIPFSTQVIIAICVLVMSSSLKSASEFRQKSSTHAILTCHVAKMKRTIPKHVSSGKALSAKDLQVVQQVVLISTMYVICNTPIIIINFAGMYNKEFALRKTYHNLFLTMIGAKHFFQAINSSFNVIIYFKYNSKFRHTLLKMFGSL